MSEVSDFNSTGCTYLSRLMTKPTNWHVRPAKTQISLGIRPIWSESSLCTPWIAKDQIFLRAVREDSDQTGWMPRLIWVFAGHTCHFVSFVMTCLIFQQMEKEWGLCVTKLHLIADKKNWWSWCCVIGDSFNAHPQAFNKTTEITQHLWTSIAMVWDLSQHPTFTLAQFLCKSVSQKLHLLLSLSTKRWLPLRVYTNNTTRLKKTMNRKVVSKLPIKKLDSLEARKPHISNWYNNMTF